MVDLELVKEWFRYANNDLIIARHSYEDLYPKLLEISCYHCQQAGEKALKGFLLYRDIEPPKIHDLQVLARACYDLDNTFAALFAECAMLTDYGSATRYPNELAVDETITQMALTKAARVYDFCAAKIPALNDAPPP